MRQIDKEHASALRAMDTIAAESKKIRRNFAAPKRLERFLLGIAIAGFAVAAAPSVYSATGGEFLNQNTVVEQPNNSGNLTIKNQR